MARTFSPRASGSRWFAAATSIGVLTGIADAIYMRDRTFNAFSSILFFLPLIWIVWCVIVRSVCLARPLRRIANWALFMAGPGMLVISRVGPELVHRFPISIVGGLAISAVIAVLLAWVLARVVPLDALRFGFFVALLWFCGTAALMFAGGHDRGAVTAKMQAPADAPNVLLIFLDTVRYDDAQLMPNLSAVASNAVVYDRAWAPAPWTVPSHFAVLTGVQPWQAGYAASSNQILWNGMTLAERFASRGYATAAIFANPLLEDDVFHRGFERFHASLRCVVCASGLVWLVSRTLTEFRLYDPVSVPAWMKASDVTAAAQKYIRNAKPPYFLAVNFMDAHDPYYLEPACRSASSTELTVREWRAWEDARDHGGALPPATLQRFHARYREVLRCLDHSLGALLERAQNTTDGRQTVVAIVGDHGEQFGNHNLLSHGQSLYRQVLHVPMVIRAADQPAHHVSDDVSITDVYGKLLRYLPDSRQATPRPRRVIAELKIVDDSQEKLMRSALCLVRGRYHLIRWADGREEIYDLESDLDETTPLPPGPADPEITAIRSDLMEATRDVSADTIGLRAIGYLQ